MSQGNLAQFSLELSKQLGIFYRSPPLPVNLQVGSPPPPGPSPSHIPPVWSPTLGSLAPPAVVGGEDHSHVSVHYSPKLRELQEQWAPKEESMGRRRPAAATSAAPVPSKDAT